MTSNLSLPLMSSTYHGKSQAGAAATRWLRGRLQIERSKILVRRVLHTRSRWLAGSARAAGSAGTGPGTWCVVW